MSKTNGNCENCHIKQRPPQKATWRVKKTKEELCDPCRVEMDFERDECELIGAPVPPSAMDRREVARSNTSLTAVADVAHSAVRNIATCVRGCGKATHRGRCSGGIANQLIKKIEKRAKPAAKPTPASTPAPAADDSLSVQVMTRAEYDAKYGLAKHWVSEEVTRVMTQLEGAPAGSVVVVMPPKNDAQSIKNLRDRLYRGFVQNKPKAAKYGVKCIQVVKAGHVLVEKVQGGNK